MIKGKLSQAYSASSLHIPYQFVERTLQTYVVFQKDKKDHVEANKYWLGAVQQTLSTVPKELSAKCDAAAISALLRPLLDSVFKLKQKKSSSSSSGGYVAMLIKNDSYTHADICKYPAVWKHYLAVMMKAGDAKGYPIVQAGETFPTAHCVYDAESLPDFKASSKKPHPDVPVFRYVALTDALGYISLLAMIFLSPLAMVLKSLLAMIIFNMMIASNDFNIIVNNAF